ncbi:hypothetical protein MKX01_017263 [Papaver californicum]|nr:hypothetical protein MKX01_017263 [Papaver californicum]
MQLVRLLTHPHVPFKEALDQTVYTTNKYHCKQCTFYLHEDCGTFPEYLTFNFHPNHELERIWEGLEEDYGLLRPCNVCGDQVKGLFSTNAHPVLLKRAIMTMRTIASSFSLHAPNFHRN